MKIIEITKKNEEELFKLRVYDESIKNYAVAERTLIFSTLDKLKNLQEIIKSWID